jgi:hypothetical protein
VADRHPPLCLVHQCLRPRPSMAVPPDPVVVAAARDPVLVPRQARHRPREISLRRPWRMLRQCLTQPRQRQAAAVAADPPSRS